MYQDLCGRFIEACPATKSGGRIMPSHWTGMHERLGAAEIVYRSMFDDLARVIGDAMNAFTINARRLYACSSVRYTVGDDERAEVVHEFVASSQP